MFEVLGQLADALLRHRPEIEAAARFLEHSDGVSGRDLKQAHIEAVAASRARLERVRRADLEVEAELTRLTQRRAQLDRRARSGELTRADLDRFERESRAFEARMHAHHTELRAAQEEARRIRDTFRRS
ncbi:hypothetical protein [Streptomyces sp. 021-4]|uniref:hypothetical protein n=1 Tax=Streptomyces sp. 021-4 TaxID=2789260 RepID=UPI0039F4CACC